MAATVKVEWWDESKVHVPAALVTLLIMAMLTMVLLKTPMARLNTLRGSEPSRMRLELVERQVQAEPADAAPRPAASRATATRPAQAQAQPAAPARPGQARPVTPRAAPPPRPIAQRAPATIPPQAAVAPASQEPLAKSLYTADGQVRLPPGVASAPPRLPPGTPPGMPSAREEAQAKNILEKPNPIHYEKTRFEKDWASSGTLGQLAGQKVGRAMKDLFKSDRNSAIARPPPETRFNPALAQNQSDLGSEATGDAYKAAPIGFEKAPQPPGEAGKRIHEQLDALQGRALMCKDPRKDKWLGDVRKNLQDLDRNETALTHGADVNRAKYYLPQAIDASYDLSRRALWYADKQLAACGK